MAQSNRLRNVGHALGVTLLAVFAFGVFSPALALSDDQLDDLVQRYGSVEKIIDHNDFTRAAGIVTGMLADYGRSEYGPELRYLLAVCYYNGGDYDQARLEFQRVADHPGLSYLQPEADYGFALASIALGYPLDAEDAVQRVLKRRGYADDPRMHLALGLIRYSTRDYNAAVGELRNDTMPEAQFYLGKALARLKNPREALLALKRVTSIAPPTPLVPLAHFAAAEALFANGDFEGAQAKLRFFMDNYPSSSLLDYAHFLFGCCQIYADNYPEAIRELAPLANSKDGYLAAHANYFIGYCNLMTGRPQEASARFQRVRTYYPYTKVLPYANLRLTQALLAVGDTFQTMVSTNQLSTMFTAGELQAVGDYLAGVLTLQLGQYERAARYFENVAIRNPQSSLREPSVALMLQGLNAGGDYHRSVTFGAKYIRDYPTPAKPAPGQPISAWRSKLLYALGEGYYNSTQYAQAEEAYRRAYESPGSEEVAPYALLGRSYSLVHLDRPDEAIPGFRELLRKGLPDTSFNASAIMGLSYAFFNRRDFDSARTGFEYVTENYKTLKDVLPNAYFYLGMSYRKLGYAGDAVDAWGTLVNNYPNHPKAAEAAFRAGETYFGSDLAEGPTKAVNNFRFVTDRYPFSIYGPSAQAFLGTCYYNMGKFPDAIREHHKYLDLYPNDPQAPSVRKSLEMEYYRVVQYDPTYIPEFLKRYPESDLAARLRYDRAVAFLQAKNYDSATVWFQTVVVNHPNSSLAPKAQFGTGVCYVSLESWQEAADAFQKYLAYYPAGADRDAALFNLGLAYFHQGIYDKALSSFQSVVNAYPSSPYVDNARRNVEVTKRRMAANPVPTPQSAPAPPVLQPGPVPGGK